MSERGQKIFKWIVWISIFLSVIIYISVGVMKYMDAPDEVEEVSMTHEDVAGVMPVEMMGNVAENSLGELYADTDGLLINKENAATFIVKANVGDKSTISIFENEELIGEMHDDGLDGDEKAGDNIFSYSLTISPENEDDIVFYAELVNNKSNEIVLSVYDEPTEEEINNANDLFVQLKSIEEAASTDGYVPLADYSTVISELYDTAERLSEERGIGIKSITKNKNGITILFDTGIKYAYILKQDGAEEGDDSVYLSVMTLEPYLNSIEGATSLPSFSPQAQKIEETVEGASYELVYNDSDVTFDNINSAFQPNSFIIWHGHGGYTDDGESFLGTGEPATTGQQLKHTIDLVAGRLVVTSNDRFAVTHKYFSKNIDDLANSFVYLGACHSAQDKMLLSVMIRKNADVAMGFTDSVLASYDSGIINALIDKLCTLDESGEEFIPMKTALGYAKKACGDNDGDETPAKPIYMGNPEYKIDRAIPKKPQLPDLSSLSDTSDLSDLPDLPDPPEIKNPIDTDKITDAVNQKIDDTVNQVTDTFMNRLQNAIDRWINENCGNC